MNKYKYLACLFSLLITSTGTLHAETALFSPKDQASYTRGLNKQLADALVDQVMSEFRSAELYLQEVSFFENRGLSGFSQYLRTHYFVEVDHGLTFFNFLVKRGIEFKIANPPIPNFNADTPLKVFQALLDSEIDTTKHLEQVSALARADHDEAAVLLLEKFGQIQIDEMYQIGRIVKRLRFAGDNPAAIFLIDQQLKDELSALGYLQFNGSIDENVHRGELASRNISAGATVGAALGAQAGAV